MIPCQTWMVNFPPACEAVWQQIVRDSLMQSFVKGPTFPLYSLILPTQKCIFFKPAPTISCCSIFVFFRWQKLKKPRIRCFYRRDVEMTKLENLWKELCTLHGTSPCFFGSEPSKFWIFHGYLTPKRDFAPDSNQEYTRGSLHSLKLT